MSIEMLEQSETVVEKELQYIGNLRAKRQRECFAITDRGQLWYDNLTDERKSELGSWYQAWLNVTDTKIVPIKPVWLND